MPDDFIHQERASEWERVNYGGFQQTNLIEDAN